MPHRFKCRTCDKWHEGFPDVGYDRPKYAADVPEGERTKRVFLTTDLCVVDDEHFFVRCVLPLKVRAIDDVFCWGVWSTLSEANFLRYQSAYDEDMCDWEPMFGYLSNALPHYPDTLGLRLSIQPQGKGDRPIATLQAADHPLAIDQRDGVSFEDVLKFVGPFMEH